VPEQSEHQRGTQHRNTDTALDLVTGQQEQQQAEQPTQQHNSHDADQQKRRPPCGPYRPAGQQAELQPAGGTVSRAVSTATRMRQTRLQDRQQQRTDQPDEQHKTISTPTQDQPS
jgi:hypothetical protein